MQFDKKSILISLLITMLLISNVLTVFWLFQNRQVPVQHVPSKSANVINQVEPVATATPAVATSTTQLASNQIQISWNEWPAKVRVVGDVFDYNLFDQACAKEKKPGVVIPLCENQNGVLKAYSLGKISAGNYSGGELFLLGELPEGPAYRDSYYRVVRFNDKLYFLAKNSESIDYSALPKSLMTVDANSYIVNLEPPLEISIPNSNIKLKRAVGYFSNYLLTDYKNPRKVFEYEAGKAVYLDEKDGCYLVAAPDGTVRQYDFALTFVNNQATSSDLNIETYRLRFINATSTTDEAYNIKPVGGCGSTGCLDYAPFIVPGGVVAKSLKLAAKGEDGSLFYEFNDLSVKFLAADRISGEGPKEQTAQMYLEAIYQLYYPSWNDKLQKQNDKMPFVDFVKKHPVLFWQDPFGNYVRLTRNEFAPGVECGKPVIYLYPQKTTTVSVQVRPNGGITKSEPSYGAGWQVEARPNGQLKNLADQRQYESLFWEGAGLNYLAPTEGFVVAKSGVEKFLTEKLAKLGLNKKETADFMAFWLPRMQYDNYYLVRFVPQYEFDRLAPLTIQPKPQTVIRIFMDYQALVAPIKVKEPIIKTPIRQGFTVVEWGGALH